MGGKFTLDNAVDGGEPDQDVVAPQIEVTSKASTRPKKSSSPAESVSSHKEDGLLISGTIQQLYQPRETVKLFLIVSTLPTLALSLKSLIQRELIHLELI
jgi:hypothetical protein